MHSKDPRAIVKEKDRFRRRRGMAELLSAVLVRPQTLVWVGLQPMRDDEAAQPYLAVEHTDWAHNTIPPPVCQGKLPLSLTLSGTYRPKFDRASYLYFKLSNFPRHYPVQF